jgi:cobalt-precorrin-5B (C1)-methyltransferase
LAELLAGLGADAALLGRARTANTANEVLAMAGAAGLPLGDAVARAAREAARSVLRTPAIACDVLVVDRQGRIVGESG